MCGAPPYTDVLLPRGTIFTAHNRLRWMTKQKKRRRKYSCVFVCIIILLLLSASECCVIFISVNHSYGSHTSYISLHTHTRAHANSNIQYLLNCRRTRCFDSQNRTKSPTSPTRWRKEITCTWFPMSEKPRALANAKVQSFAQSMST